MRESAYHLVAIPADFWTRRDVTQALTSRDIAELFRLIKLHTGITYTRIGAATGNAQGRISEIINGKSHVRTVVSMTRIADGLGMPAPARAALGLAHGPSTATPARQATRTVPATGSEPVPTADYPVTAEQAVTASTGLWAADEARSEGLLSAPLDPAAWNAAALTWLVSPPGDTLPANPQGRAVGLADVTRVRDSTELFAKLDNRFGGAIARRPLIHFLDCDAAALLAGSYTEETGRALFAAVAEASLLAAWTSYDCGLHGLGQRHFVHALRLAQMSGNRQLACSIMSAMSHQAAYTGHLPEAANLARAACGGLRDQATPALTAQFLAMEARALARSGDNRGCQTVLVAAERAFQAPEPGRDPDFISYFNEAEFNAEAAHCFRDLGDPRRAIQHAAMAVPSDGQYARSDFFVTMVHADALADQDELQEACSVALDALRIGAALTSARCVTYLREFRKRLTRFGDHPAVRDFTEQAAGNVLWVKAA